MVEARSKARDLERGRGARSEEQGMRSKGVWATTETRRTEVGKHKIGVVRI